jgi:hypothetical protein
MFGSVPMIVPINHESSAGLNPKCKPSLQTPTLIISNIMHKLKIVFGFFVIVVTLLSSGCANLTAPHRPMHYSDLEWFAVDCKLKTEQIAMLQAMRPTNDEKLFARLNNELFFWQVFSDPDKFEQRRQIGMNRIDWLINQHLMRLREC